MERYSEYKDSGVEWLGEIPRHWEVIKNKYLFSESDERNVFGEYKLLSFSKSKGIIPYDQNTDKESSAEDIRNYKVLHKGQLLENRLQAWNGMFQDSSVEGCVSPDYSVFNLIYSNANIKYYSYLFKTDLYIAQWANASKGIGSGFNRLYTPQFGNIVSLVPPIEEQNAIVSYLDKVTSKIDAAIAQQQKMIELLNERKQIIINNAVTKGLVPTAKMKPSGIPWLGNIPAHWRTVPIKRYISVKTGKTPSTTNKNFFDGGTINWFTPGDIMTTKLCASDRKVTQKAIKEDTCPLFTPYTVYLVGIGGTIGKVAYSEKEASCNQQINALIPNEKYVHYKYLALFIHTSTVQIYQNANLSTLPIINQERTGSLLLSLPSITEQKNIVKYIETKTQPIVNYIQRVKEKMELLQERKQIIINEVVTGKVKI